MYKVSQYSFLDTFIYVSKNILIFIIEFFFPEILQGNLVVKKYAFYPLTKLDFIVNKKSWWITIAN